MKCRKLVKSKNGKQNIVWFKSIGVQESNDTISLIAIEYDRGTGVQRHTAIIKDIHNFIFSSEYEDRPYCLKFHVSFGRNFTTNPVIAFLRLIDKNTLMPTNTFSSNMVIAEPGVPSFDGDLILPFNQDVKNILFDRSWYPDNKILVLELIAMSVRESDVNVFSNLKVEQYVLNSKKVDDNYATEQEGVAASLIQRLSVLKGELWYKQSYGLPLTEKIKSKGIFDAIIVDIITSHPDVVNIESFESTFENSKYTFSFVVNTVYNKEVSISYLL